MKLRALFGQALSKWTDQELLQALRERRSDRLFDELFRRHHPLVYAWCLRWTDGQREIAKDLTVGVFQKAWQQIDQQAISDVEGWLAVLTKHHCIDHLRRAQREEEQLEKWLSEQKKTDFFVENEGFLRLINRGLPQIEQYLADAVATLPDGQGVCLQLFFWEQKSYREIAAQTGYTEKQVKSYLQNGKRRLQVSLRELLDQARSSE